MGRVLAFLRSMRFGVMLLAVVMAFSLLGSLIPQGRGDEWYRSNYPSMGGLVVSLGLHNMFSAWYFILPVALLAANLTLCSVIRFGKINKAKQAALLPSEHSRIVQRLSGEQAERLRWQLTQKRYRRMEVSEAAVYYKNMPGYYGSFVVHLSLLFILVFGGLVLGLSKVADYNIIPGTTRTLPDGTQVYLSSFRIQDSSGRTDYASIIEITSPGGSYSGSVEISVNNPFSFDSRKYYQHSFGTVGAVKAHNTATGGEDLLHLTSSSFLSEDGRNGIWFEALFPSYIEDAQGNITPVSYAGGSYPHPVYRVMVSEAGSFTLSHMLPGESVKAGDIIFTFETPITYPGIRIKDVPHPLPALLYASFALMLLGFWLSFFCVPSVVTLRGGEVTLSGLKAEQAELDIAHWMQEEKKIC